MFQPEKLGIDFLNDKDNVGTNEFYFVIGMRASAEGTKVSLRLSVASLYLFLNFISLNLMNEVKQVKSIILHFIIK